MNRNSDGAVWCEGKSSLPGYIGQCIYIGNVTSLLVSYFTLCPHWSVKYSSLNPLISAYPGPHVAHLKLQNSSQTDSTTLLTTLHYKLWMTLMKRPHQHRSVNWLNQTIICSITFCHKSHSTWRWVWLYWVVWNNFDSFGRVYWQVTGRVTSRVTVS